MFGFIKEKLSKIYTSFTEKVSAFFGSTTTINEATYKELEKLFITADTGLSTTRKLIANLKASLVIPDATSDITPGQALKDELHKQLVALLGKKTTELMPKVVLLVGVNGSGKTTFLSKFAYKIKQENKRALLVAADTFRAAAVDQLTAWGTKIGIDVASGSAQQDPASVVFDGCKKFKDEQYDYLLIDTAGRLQTKVNLMKELEKIKRIVSKQLGDDQEVHTWLTIDTMLGQNSLAQAEKFHEATQVNGIILTKCDGTGKGGIIFSIADKLQLPICYMTCGEHPEDLVVFNSEQYVRELLEKIDA